QIPPLDGIKVFLLLKFISSSSTGLDGDLLYISSIPKLGFGKDKHIGTYKPVFLYNSFEFGLVKFLMLALILGDGSLDWLTEYDQEGICKVLSFELHTETFQVICNAPIPLVFYASRWQHQGMEESAFNRSYQKFGL
ncbi:unnamed protein product, partial [Eruca vesicaria subsp. sativa]|nr:unnamed protein product [Eruca vesicaria subsp. sativa]